MSDVGARIEELLVAEAIGDLSAAEARELASLLDAHPGVDRHAFERMAANVFLGAAGPLEPIPDAVSRRVVAEAGRQLPGAGLSGPRSDPRR